MTDRQIDNITDGVPIELISSKPSGSESELPKVYILHENQIWLPPFRKALQQLNTPFHEWIIAEGSVSVSSIPPRGVYFNRTSPSSHTRAHRFAPEYTSAVLSWLESHGRKVVNGFTSLSFEVNKVRQEAYLHRFGIATPRTIAAVGGPEKILEAASILINEGNNFPFLLKHNRSGSGYGIQLFNSLSALSSYLSSPSYLAPVDGIVLLQKYIRPRELYITRAEFVNKQCIYTVRIKVDDLSLSEYGKSAPSFNLCPNDVCSKPNNDTPTSAEVQAPEANGTGSAEESKHDDSNVFSNCAVAQRPVESANEYKFNIVKVEDCTESVKALLEKLTKFVEANNIEVAGIEFVEDVSGSLYVYDVNACNTNYNHDAEVRAQLAFENTGPGRVATYLTSLLKQS